MNKTTFDYPQRMYGHMTLRPKNQILADDSTLSTCNTDIDESQTEMSGLETTSIVQDQGSGEVDCLMLPERVYEEPECSICLDTINE